MYLYVFIIITCNSNFSVHLRRRCINLNVGKRWRKAAGFLYEKPKDKSEACEIVEAANTDDTLTFCNKIFRYMLSAYNRKILIFNALR